MILRTTEEAAAFVMAMALATVSDAARMRVQLKLLKVDHGLLVVGRVPSW